MNEIGGFHDTYWNNKGTLKQIEDEIVSFWPHPFDKRDEHFPKPFSSFFFFIQNSRYHSSCQNGLGDDRAEGSGWEGENTQ